MSDGARCLELDKHHGPAFISSAKACLGLNEFEQAIELLDRGLRLGAERDHDDADDGDEVEGGRGVDPPAVAGGCVAEAAARTSSRRFKRPAPLPDCCAEAESTSTTMADGGLAAADSEF